MPLEVLQISDLHLTEPGSALLGRDPDETLQSVLDHVARRGRVPDVVVASGDLVHDGDHAAHVERFARFGDWAFVFVDSNRKGRTRNEHGRLVDLEDRGHAARLGAVDAAELDWVERAVRSTDAAHVFVWVHHPPVVHPKFQPPARSAYCDSLLARLDDPRVRAIGAGHLHCGFDVSLDGLAMYGCPSTWLVMDFDTDTIALPGYRWYSLHDDGQIETAVHASDDRRFAERAPLPAFVVKLMTGEMGLGNREAQAAPGHAGS